MMRGFISLYLPSYPTVLVYMLQSTEYKPGPYLRWFWRTKDYSEVMHRRTLDRTRAARLLLLALRLGILLQIAVGLFLIYLGGWHGVAGGVAFGAALIVAYPVTWAHLLVLPLLIGQVSLSGPAQQREIKRSEKTFAGHKAIKVAVAGSYGKTTMKELLLTVLNEGLRVAATPANKNVSISHARWAKQLAGDEDVLIIEYGEGAPGDVARFARITQPTHAVITGLAPAHLDQYKTLKAAGEDIFAVADYLKGNQVYVNSEAPDIKSFLKPSYETFNEKGALGWKASEVEVSLDGTSFTLKKGKQSLNLQSGLAGRHQVGFLAFVAAFALQLGLSEEQVQTGIAKTMPFEHRMKPYQLAGAWVVDDTYNGNLEGIRAGTQLLKDLEAQRKIYVTPGLVDQGEETERVHVEVGKLIAAAKPNLVVLMQNSTTDFIAKGLKEGNFKGDLRLQTDPLDFYSNLSHFVAAGDLVVMQNDWTDNYA
ncbi:MAG TPA: Mur ligase family protein [Candidatus Saccharimonadia bacterium]|nr:Mur ligase family protein [Candidatus Saccharimonadia bacterium]